MRALVTGAGGFVGQWLCAELLRDGWDVHGAAMTGAPAGGTLKRWQREAVFWHDVDLRERDDTAAVIDAAQPDAIFHLAAISHVPDAEAQRDAAWSTNVGAAQTLLDLVVERRAAGTLDPAVVIVGSAEEYGRHDASELPLTEQAELRPMSVYAETKVAQERAALDVWRETGARVVAARPFNHTGPGQSPTFLVPALVQRAREAIELGQETVSVGNLDVVRDFLHVEDVVRAYIFLALRGVPGDVYNICSGVGTPVANIVTQVCHEVAGSAMPLWDRAAKRAELKPVVDPALARPADVPALVGDPSKLTRDTSWTPKFDLSMAITDLIYHDDFDEDDAEAD